MVIEGTTDLSIGTGHDRLIQAIPREGGREGGSKSVHLVVVNGLLAELVQAAT